MVVERLGSIHKVYSPGWFISVPIFDQIAYCVDMREQTIYYPPQNAVTKDNVTVRVDAIIFVRFVDALKAAYGATDPLRSVQELAKSAMRAAVGELELDALFHSRKYVNERVSEAVTAAASNWGLIVTRHEILDVKPDKHILDVMDKQAAAERMRREKVLEAEGEKQAATLKSEGVRIRLVNESEGNLTRVKNEATAEQSRLRLEAEGRAKAILAEAEARSSALKMMSKAFREDGAIDAARLLVAREYVSMYGEMGKTSNTIMINDKPADVAALLAQATMALQKQ
ncbi:Stomatin [Gracilaria domingensis]|nr:Stomatin [Gracilaria domingensis]